MDVDLYYHPKRNEYVFISGDKALRVDEEEFKHMSQSLNPLMFHAEKTQCAPQE